MLEIHKVYHGFELLESKEIKEIQSVAYRFVHKKSGARLLFLENNDDNKVFSVTFRTPPDDSTGVAHIVEHSVLCGSKKFPLKEPFVELIKGSLNTYLNAMTFPDKTMYPVASRNDKDFNNLMDVYLDAVFYPCMAEQPEVFMQEGWHYEINEPQDELTYKGVVYNEMKGAFSSPEAVLDKEILASLFPNTTYGYESGGDPEVIPELTHEMFIKFHKRYYHPSNSYLYLYGKMDIQDKLAFLDKEYLSSFSKQEIDSNIAVQPSFDAPEVWKAEYSVAKNEQLEDKTFLGLSFVVGQSQETEQMLAMQILEHFLLKTQAAPLKKALIDAEIGKDVMSSFSESILQPTFSVIVSGSNGDKAETFKNIVYETLERLVRDGIDKQLIEASINLLEFRLREADFGQSPKGLIYNINLMNTWLYDSDPFAYLTYEHDLASVKRALTEAYFEQLIQERFIDNKHTSLVVLQPNPGLGERKDKEVRDFLAEYKSKLSADEINNLIAMTKKLKQRQETPDEPECLTAIPLLQLSDIKEEAEQLVLVEKKYREVPVLFHPIPTNKIAYFNLYFDMEVIPESKLQYAFLLSELLGKVDTGRYTYSDLANRINLCTGGISYDVTAYTECSSDKFYPKFKVKSKALVAKLPDTVEVLGEILCGSKFEDQKRLKELLEHIKSLLEMYVLRNSQQIIAGRIFSYFSPAGKYNEQGLLSFYEFVTELLKNFAQSFPSLQANLREVRDMIFDRRRLLISVTLEEEDYPKFEDAFSMLDDVLFDCEYPVQPYEFFAERRNEGLLTSSKVQYVGKGANFLNLGYQYTGSMKVLETILRYDYFWNRIRVQGGAYGAFTQFRRNGNMLFGSYRDPNLSETIGVYDQTATYLRNFNVSEREMLKYIIGTISYLDTPLTAQMKGEVAAECYIRHISQEAIQQERNEVLKTRPEDIKVLADIVDSCMKENYLCVLGEQQKIKENESLFNTLKQVFA